MNVEHEIGYEFRINRMYVVVVQESPNKIGQNMCKGCYFLKQEVCFNIAGSCSSEHRKDRKDIIYKKVEKRVED